LIRVAELASVIDPNREQIVTREVLRSAQDFTPFAGMRVRGWPTHTLLGSRTVFQDGAVAGHAARTVRQAAPSG